MAWWNRIPYFGKRRTAEDLIRFPRSSWVSRGSVVVNEDTSMQVSSFYRGLIYVSTQIAKLPWEVKDVDNKVLDNDISALLNLAPNDEMNAFQFRLWAVQNAIIHGNSYAEIERDVRGVPIALWPLITRNVQVVRMTDGRLMYRVMSGDGRGKQVYLAPRDVFHTRNFHTKDGIVGQGLVAYASETLGIQVASDRMASGIFHNGGVPSGIIQHPGKLSPEAHERLKKSWGESNQGRNSGATRILEEDAKYMTVSIDPETLQFLQTRQFGVIEQSRFFGIPPTKFFDVTAATYSNVEQANLEVATDTLHAWCTNLEMEADVKLLSRQYAGKYTELDLYYVFRGDMKTRADYFKTMVSIGSMTPNEIRLREGMPDYKEGDNFYIATNNFTPVNRMNEVIDAQIKGKTQPGQAANDPNNADTQVKKAAAAFLLKSK